MEATSKSSAKSQGTKAAMHPPLPPTNRTNKIRAIMVKTPHSICLERPTLLNKFTKTPEGRKAQIEHPLVRRAKALAYLMANRKPIIWDDEIIIGNMTSKRIAANYYPEGGSINVLEDIFRLEKRTTPIYLSTKEKFALASTGIKNLFSSIGGKALLRPGRISHFLDFFYAKRYFITEEAGVGHQVGGYHNVVHHGLVRADEIAKKCLDTKTLPDGRPIDKDQTAFYQSIRITINGIREMARNLGAEAGKKADEKGISKERKTELLELEQACLHVPYNPARTFLEGLQACWLVHIALNMEDFEQGMSFGRLDQILFDLYKNDISKGRLTKDKAIEILAGFELKTCETIPLYSERIDKFFSGNGVAQGITLGGVDAKGDDVTNELSALFLDAYAQIQTREPALHVRVHPKTPKLFLDKAVQIVQLGCGKPSFFGDQAVIAALENIGMTTPHARDYAIIGCVEMASQGRTYNSSDAALFNLPLCLELALNQGKRFLGRNFTRGRLGAKTNPVTQLKTFDDVVDAFRIQVKDSVDEMRKVIGWIEDEYRQWRTTPVNSMVTKGCLESGKDVTWGGGFYDLTSIQVAGLADVGDSLLAINKLVFQEKRFSLAEFVDILKNDFKDHHALQTELSNKLPRFGNSIPQADRMTQLAADVFSDTIRANKNGRGGKYVPGIYSMTCHNGFGKITGALPNGRKAGMRLSNGLSPADGKDRRGPTAVLRSAASLDSTKWANCYALNLKFDKNLVQGKAGNQALSGMFRAFFDDGGMQVQVNVLDGETLRQAKSDPSAHPGLVVRVAGYCAYFNDLSPDVQQEIIERSSHGTG